MKENFDCTQFITFDLQKNKEGLDLLIGEFNKIGFEVITNMRKVKEIYFKDYLGEYFIELKDDDFMGEFEDWESIGEPTKRIEDFINSLKKIAQINNMKNLTVILTYFAELGDSTNKVINVEISDIQQGLYIMSKHNFDFCVDNLILRIEI